MFSDISVLAHFYKKRNDYLLYVNLLLHMQKISSILSSKPKQTFQQEQTYQVNKKRTLPHVQPKTRIFLQNVLIFFTTAGIR